MNYAGKFDGGNSFSGHGSVSHTSSVQLGAGHAHAPADAIVVPDAHFLFSADFKRSGVDLVLTGDDRELVLHDYFKTSKHAALASPDGAHLTGDIVDALTGHLQVSQAGGAVAAANQVIGHVTKLAGSATVIRNGVSIILNMGDNVEKGDVVQSGANSTVGLTFIDGTVFGLSSNARMVLNDMVYDPNGSNNSSLMSLVAGTITFVAGDTARHGDMKVDTPIATMGIRGTACLVEIDFTVVQPSNAQQVQPATPSARFQVLVEPDGTTGSYILFDKVTLQPIAIVNQAGQQVNINNGVVTQTQVPLSPELQKLITDVFQQKFTDTDTNTKTASTIGSSTADNSQIITFQNNGITATAIFQTAANTAQSQGSSGGGGSTGQGTQHVSGPPDVRVFNGLGVETKSYAFAELLGKTNDTTDKDTTGGRIVFADINVGDAPTAKIDFGSAVFKDAAGHTVGLNALQLSDIAATVIDLNPSLVADPGNNNNGSYTWSYSLPDNTFDFLGAGETVTLTYFITVNNNYAPNTETTKIPITITIVGTNDQPIITTDHVIQTIAFSGGTSTSGGPLVTGDETSGTLAFTDVDLTDTHTVSATLTSWTMSDGSDVPPAPLAAFKAALTAAIAADSTGSGNGTINWQLADLPAFDADFIPTGETLTLTYTVTMTDSQGVTDTKTFQVTITGTDHAAQVWIHTTDDGSPDNLWTTAQNWETGTVPIATDDVIIITDQLHGHVPSFPAVIDASTDAVAKSVTMNDFTTSLGDRPELDNFGTLTIATSFVLGADSILHNFGTVNVGTKIELLDNGIVPNAAELLNTGTLNLGLGGDFQGLASVSNSGTIELQGGTLNVLVDLKNSIGATAGEIIVDGGAKLVLGIDPANAPGITGEIDGGKITIKSGGELDLTGGNVLKNGALTNGGQVNVTGTGNTLDGETVYNNAGNATAIDIIGALTLKGGGIINAVFTSSGETVESGATLTLQDSGILNGEVTNKGTLNLGSSGLNSGKLTNTGQINVSGTSGLSDESVSNTGNGSAIDITGALSLTNATTITNTDDDSGETIESSGSLTLWDNASISGGTVTNKGTLTFEQGALKNGTLANTGEIDVDFRGSLSGETVTANNKLEVFAGSILTIDQGSFITNTGTIKVDAGANLNVSDTTIDGGLIVASGMESFTGSVVLQNGTLQGLDSNLSNVTIKGAANAFHNEKVTDANLILAHATGAELAIDQGSVVDNTEISIGGGTLTLNDVTFQNGSVISNQDTVDLTGQVLLKDGGISTSSKFNVSGGGNVFDNETVENELSGIIDVSGELTAKNGTTFTNTKTSSETIEGTLTLLDTSSITSGAVTVSNTGKLNLQGTSFLKDGTLTNGNQVNVSGTGNAFDNEIVDNNGTIDVASSALLTLENGTKINGGTLTIGGALESIGTNFISGTTISNTSHIDVVSGTLTIDPAGVTNTGTIDVEGGATLVFDGETITNSVTDPQTLITTKGTIQVDATDASHIGTLDLEDSTIVGGTVAIAGRLDSSGVSFITGAMVTVTGTVDVSIGTLTLDSVTLDGSGSVTTDDGATLDLLDSDLSGVTLDGAGTIETAAANTDTTLDGVTIADGVTVTATVGELDLTGTIVNKGEIDATTGTVDLDNALLNGGELDGNGLFDVTSSSTVENAILNNSSMTIESGQTLTLIGDTINGTTINFAGLGDTLQLDATSAANFNGTVSGLVIGDVIDLTGTVVSTAVWNGTTLVLDGTATTFQISALPSADDTFAFKGDGHGGTDLKVLKQVLTVGSTAAEGVETKAIPLHFSDTLTGGATLTAFVISAIPANAVLSDGTHTVQVTNGTLDVAGWDLTKLTITPTNDSNFVLSAMVTATDPDGYEFTVPSSEVVTVDPTSPTLSWSTSVTGTETQVALGSLTETITGAPGDANVANTLTLSGMPQGAVLSDGHGHSVTSDGTTPIDISAWSLSSLTIDSSNVTVPDQNFTLTVTATERDAEGDISAQAIATEAVIINPTAPVLNWTASVTGTETQVALGTLTETITGAPGDSNVENTLTISGAPKGAVLSDGHGHTAASDGTTPIDISAWSLSSLSIDTSGAAVPDRNFTLTATATEKDAEGNISGQTSTTESVIINPTAPTLSWAASVTGTETQVALGNLAETITGAPGDSNVGNTLTISGAPKYAVLSDGHGHYATSDGSTPISVVGWTLSSLSIDTSDAAVPDRNFSLTATATEKDAEGNISAQTITTESVIINPTAPTLNWTASVTGTETQVALGSLTETITGAPGDSNVGNTLTISGAPQGAVLSDGHGHSVTSDGSTPISVVGWTLSSLMINTSNTTVPDRNFTLTATATEKDAEGNISAQATATESVIIKPTAPTLSWTPSVTGPETQISLGSLTETITGAAGDSNVANTLTISGVPKNAVLSDGHGHSATSDGSTPISVAGWTLSSLSLDATKSLISDSTNFTLTATATEKDAEGNVSAQTTATEQVTVTRQLTATLDHATAEDDETIHVLQVTDTGGIVVTTGITYAWQQSTDGGQHWTTVGTNSSFRVGEAQEGKLMQLVVNYTDATGTESVTYNLGTPIDLAVTVDTTTAQLGLPIHVTSVTDGGHSVSTGVTYAWQTSIDGGQHWTTVGTNSSYTPTINDVGDQLQLVVNYTDPGESESVTDSFGIVASAKEWKSNAASPWDTAGQWSPSGVPGATDNAVIDTATGHSFKLSVTQTNDTAHSLVLNSSIATVEIVNGAALTLSGNLTIDAGNFQIDSGGLLKFTGASSTITGSFSNAGTVEVGAGDKLEVASTNVSGDGGVFKIDAGATLQLDHSIGTKGVVFAGSGTLVIEDPAHFNGTVSDSTGSMTSGDVLDLIGFDTNAVVTYNGNGSGGTVTVTEAGHSTAQIKVGANSTHWTAPVSDGHGGILIHDPPEDNQPVPVQMPANFAADGFAFKPNLGAGPLVSDFIAHAIQVDHGAFASFAELFAHDAPLGGGAPIEVQHVLQDIKALLLHQQDFHFV